MAELSLAALEPLAAGAAALPGQAPVKPLRERPHHRTARPCSVIAMAAAIQKSAIVGPIGGPTGSARS